MRGKEKVIAQLNDALRSELIAINQYFLHAEMCDNWGYHKLGAFIKKQSVDDLKLEHEAFTQYNAAIQVCADEGDNTSADLFEKLLADEEKHIDFLETQLHIIKDIGIQNYLAKQMEAAS